VLAVPLQPNDEVDGEAEVDRTNASMTASKAPVAGTAASAPSTDTSGCSRSSPTPPRESRRQRGLILMLVGVFGMIQESGPRSSRSSSRASASWPTSPGCPTTRSGPCSSSRSTCTSSWRSPSTATTSAPHSHHRDTETDPKTLDSDRPQHRSSVGADHREPRRIH
jgi:hypothetical protein